MDYKRLFRFTGLGVSLTRCGFTSATPGSPIIKPSRTLVRWKYTPTAAAADPFSSRLTTLGFRGPAVMKLEKVPSDVTRVEIIKELMAAGPVGRVLSLSISLPDTSIGTTMRHNRTQVRIEYDTKGEVERLAYLIREGLFTVRGHKPLYFQTYGDPDTPPWLALDAHADGTPVHLLPDSQLPSRVLRIMGFASSVLMAEASLRVFFEQQRINVETEHVGIKDYRQRASSTMLRIIEWRFCDWTSQARLAYLALGHVEGIYVTYGLDPCERGYSLHELDQPLPSKKASQKPQTQDPAQPEGQAQPDVRTQHGDQGDPSNNQELGESALQASEAVSLVEKRRKDFAHPEFDTLARAWSYESQDLSPGDWNQRERQLQRDTSQTAQSAPSHPVAPATPAPSPQDSPSGPPTQRS